MIAQHIPAGFSRAFAERLNQICAMEVKEAADGDELLPGRALVAPGDFHMRLERSGGVYRASVQTGPRVCYQRPSVDVLFQSVAQSAGKHAVGVLLETSSGFVCELQQVAGGWKLTWFGRPDL